MADGSLQMTQMQQFVPDAATARDLRDAFGRFATGVTVDFKNDPTTGDNFALKGDSDDAWTKS